MFTALCATVAVAIGIAGAAAAGARRPAVLPLRVRAGRAVRR